MIYQFSAKILNEPKTGVIETRKIEGYTFGNNLVEAIQNMLPSFENYEVLNCTINYFSDGNSISLTNYKKE